MTNAVPVRVAHVADALRGAGYDVAERDLADQPAVLAETPYALVGCVELTGWDGLAERLFDVQAALTHVADEAPSVRSWDLYLVALVTDAASTPAHRAVAERIEADTRYARKFVHIALLTDALDRALRPLLPLRPPVAVALSEPLDDLLDELLELHVEQQVAKAAIASFARTSTVEIP